MPSFHPSAVAWMRTHHGVISRHRLLELGVTRSAIEAMLLAGELVCIHEGVYRPRCGPPPSRQNAPLSAPPIQRS